MSNSNEFQTLARVTTEIDESEVKLTYMKQCIKAQEDLSNKLKAEIERRKEVCNFQKNANLILQTEVQNAEHVIKNSITTHNAITSANTQTKRELLLAQEYNVRLGERMRNAEKKYEDIWIECKKKYESIPIVQKLLETTKKMEIVQVDIKVLENEMTILNSEFKIKKAELVNKDRKQIIQLVQFIVHDMPVAIKIIKEKSMETRDLKIQIDSIIKEQETNHSFIINKILGTMDRQNLKQYEDNNKVENWAKIKKNDDDILVMPRLQLPSFEPDVTSVKLEINKVGFQSAPVKRTISANEKETNPIKPGKDGVLINHYLSCYFKKSNENVVDKPNQKPEDFSKRKLINILEDVKLDEQETYKIISKVNMDKCQDVHIITAENARDNSPPKRAKVVTPLESEEIEEIDISNTNDGNVLVPPSQFLDLSQDKGLGGYQQDVDVIVHVSVEETSPKDGKLSQIKTSQEDVVKKRVSFDIPMSVQVTDEIENEITPDNKGNQTNDTIVSQLDLCIEGGDNFSSIKDMILKKHNLDLSPQFVYGKNMMMLQKKTEDKLVTSKFFESNTQYFETDELITENNGEVNKLGPKETSSNKKPQVELYEIPQEGNLKSMEDVNGGLSSKVNKIEEPVAGLLFTHGPQGIPDCLDISMSTNDEEGYEEGDSDFPTGLDSSLLLSPKADTSANCVEVGSQEVPNFLSGFTKAGLSFFKQNAPSGNNSDSSKPNQQDTFSFNFCSEDKKSKGGIFSFFH